jgi:hypothetical protein
MKHEGVKKVLEKVSYDFEQLDDRTQNLLLRELGIKKIYTIKKYLIDEKKDKR